MDNNPIVIVAAKRSPMGSFMGELSALEAHLIGAQVLRATLAESGVDKNEVDEVIMGCVLPAGQGQAPARQAALGAGLPASAGATMVHKVCGSGLKAVMNAYDSIKLGHVSTILAGGMESMTNAPYLLKKARMGARLGHDTMYDHMMLDALENAYDGQSMGCFGELCADKYGFSRQEQDDFAITSLKRALEAISTGYFAHEIAPLTIATKKGDVVVETDEQPRRAKIDKIPELKPAFKKDGSLTAANSSSISDGAAALLVTDLKTAQAKGLKPIAKILGHSTHAQEPEWFTTAPVGAINKLLKGLDLTTKDIDLYEINEAFAVVAMAAMKELDLDHEQVNVHGGACALGHPVGASGARILVTLIHALQTRGQKRGVAAICLGGGEGVAMAVELIK